MVHIKKYLPKALLFFVVITILLAVVIWQRHQLIAHLYNNENPALLAATDEGVGVEWFDDYFTVEKIGENIYAIGEPRYWQRNYNYLVIGDERALLIDAGPGVRDIRPVVKSLTDLPYTLVTTHFHFDHVASGLTFPRVAMVDLPHLRKRTKGNIIQLTLLEHLGKTEGYPAPAIRVDQWLAPDSKIDLGNRTIDVIYTPGHTVESISFLDREQNILFTGDWFTPILGPMFSNSNMGDFLLATENVLCIADKNTRVFGAHKYVDGGGAPEQTMQDIENAQNGLRLIRSNKLNSEGFYPAVYQLTPEIELYADITWLQNWTPVYPDFKRRQCH